MRTNGKPRAPRARHLAVGALILAVPGTAVAMQTDVAQALGATTGPALHSSVARHSLRYGRYETVHGSAPSGDAGNRVELEFEPAGTGTWQSLAQSTIASNDHFSFRVRMHRSGSLRAVSSASAGAHSTSTPPAPSTPQHVGVAAGLRVARRSHLARTGHRITVRGDLEPGQPGLRVRLMARTDDGWRTMARASTGRRGGFVLRYVVHGAGTKWLRVSFAGDQSNRSSWTRAGTATGLVPRVASWYNDAGDTACGFHARYGVASRTLPCGTKVTFAYDGRSVVATVDDRGPYVYSRDYDLNQNTASALGMDGVATVLASR